MPVNYIIIGIAVVVLLWLLVTYNSLITLRNRVREAWSQIDVQLKRRSSLIPNLVEAVKGYVKHEKGVLEEVTKARTSLMSAKNPHEAAEADNMLTGALKSLFAVAENYPNLKASENFKQLQDELSDTETKVAASRQFYNTNVLDLNNNLETIPSAWVGSMFGFKKEDFFKATEEEKKDIQVKF
ncbi:MAG: LemA family protein [Candidatus Daviesbacteria bacterium]|nr:MAG: LemA family protein [Candidatus Daviesbacteria bacterium]